MSADIDKWDLMMLHWKAWELGIKSLYYCRSKSIQRASFAGVEADNTKNWPEKIFQKQKLIMKNVYLVNKLKEKMDSFNEKIKSKVGLLTPSHSYKPFRYPWAYDFWKRQQQVHWMPEEVPLGEDCKDWAVKLNDNEKKSLNTNI